MEEIHCWILIGFFAISSIAAFPSAQHEDTGAENSKSGGIVRNKIQICGQFRIKEAIKDICKSKTMYRPHGRTQRDVMIRRPNRSVVDECCRLGCKYSDLLRYCGRPMEQKARSMSLQDFLHELAQFFQQSSRRQSSDTQVNPVVRVREDGKEVVLEDSEEGLSGTDDGKRRARRKHVIYSDETPQDLLEEELRSAFEPIPSLQHIVQTEYKARPTNLSGMEKIELERGSEIAVIIPDRHI